MKPAQRAAWLKVINALLAASILLIAASAALSSRIIPLGFYRLAHVVPGLIFLGLLVAHLFLNQGWIKSTYFKKK
jgi:hypothetical protein